MFPVLISIINQSRPTLISDSLIPFIFCDNAYSDHTLMFSSFPIAAATDAIVSHTGQNWMARWGIADDTTVCIVNLEHTTYLQTPQIRN